MTETETVKDLTEETTQPADETAYTPDKQEIDQERANARRAREELESISEAFESQSAKVQLLERELDELKAAREAEQTRLDREQQDAEEKLDEMDPDMVDSSVVRNIKRLEALQKKHKEEYAAEKAALQDEIKSLRDESAKLKAERQQNAETERHTKLVNAVLNRTESLLKKHGVESPGKYRTDALKLADELVDKGQVPQPNSEKDGESQAVLDGIELMHRCYLEVKSRQEKKSRGVSVDDGGSGVEPGVSSSEIKPGSLADVKAQMAKNKSWKGT